ncbi:hypothetical protein SSPSH_001049 [Salinisphaera shabanensis E1L3A]|uniref:Uncharacterized protein n=1 Tax=Salinisphaera shabanensis E1L3A TaxID=1033802 RepID=U2FVD7_9GAMM|nr:hypothetical protein SSPSH_001049 [Salinisphaera shabanensis E1L3A]
MRVERQVWSLNRWQTITLIVLQLLLGIRIIWLVCES